MTCHIHAELTAQYAQDAMETDKPWERWEFYGRLSEGWSEGWMPVEAGISTAWWPDVQYRRKPKPYEPTLLDQALELEIEAARLRRDHWITEYQTDNADRESNYLETKISLRTPAMIEHLKSQGKL